MGIDDKLDQAIAIVRKAMEPYDTEHGDDQYIVDLLVGLADDIAALKRTPSAERDTLAAHYRDGLVQVRDTLEKDGRFASTVATINQHLEEGLLVASRKGDPLAVLMDAVQYAVNRLDADNDQPQVSGDLAVALAYARSVTASSVEPINQCDGCRRGLPLRANNIHYDGEFPSALPVMGCTADRYISSASEPKTDRLLDELIARDERLEAMVRKAVDTGDLAELRDWLKVRVGVRFITDTAFGGD